MKLPISAPGFRRSAGLFLIAGLLCTAVATWGLAGFNKRQLSDALDLTGERLASAISERVTLYQYGLRGARGAVLVAGEQEITRDLFRRYSRTRDLEREFPGARGFGFIRRVMPEDLAAFIERVRRDDAPDFNVHGLGPAADEHFVIQYVEPLTVNAPALGLDIASEANRRNAAQSAMDSGEVRLSGPITLVQAQGAMHQSFLILLPVYRTVEVPDSIAMRRQTLFGWTYAALMMGEVLDSLQLSQRRVHVAISDITNPASEQPFYTSGGGEQGSFRSDHSQDIDVLGRRWRLQMEATPAFIAQLNLVPPMLLAGGGALASLLLALLAGTLTVSRAQQRQIQRARLQLGSLVEHSSDCIIGEDLEGRVIGWNRGAELLFGYSADEAVGRALADLILPPEEQAAEARLRQRVAAGETLAEVEGRARTRDGRVFAVSLSGSPIHDEHGGIVGMSSTVRDITEQKAESEQMRALASSLEQEVTRRTEELTQLDQLLSGVLQSTRELGIYSTDAQGLVHIFNPGAERMLGYSAEEAVGRLRASDFIASDAGASADQRLLRRKDGSLVTVSLVESPIADGQGRPLGILGIIVDLSERQAYEQRLAASLALTRAILDTVVDPVLSLDAAGVVQSINPAGSRVFGYAREEAIGQPIERLLPSAWSEAESGPGHFVAQAHPGDSDSWALTGRRRDGSDFPARVSIGAMDEAGERLFVCVVIDITEQEHQRRELLEVRDHLLLAAEAAELGIWAWELADGALVFNARMFELYRLDPALAPQLRYEHWRERLHPDDVASTEAALQGLIEHDQPFTPTFRILLPDDEEVRYVKAGARVERDEHGKAVRLTGINLDVSEQQEQARYLQRARQAADEASAAKSSFLANMSHEIRTPMNAVLGMLQLLQRTRLDTLQRDYVDKSRQAAWALLELLNDILDYSKIEAGKLQLDVHAFELEDLMRQLGVILSGNQGEKPVEVMFDLDPQVPRNLLGDGLRLKQVLVNLAGNALKFTLRGQVVVAVKRLELEGNRVRLRFSVTDSGIGIDPEQRQRIFEGFTQAEASTRRRFGGTGLGLVICQRLVELMGGSLELRSRPGEGSRFWFDIELGCETPDELLCEPSEQVLRLMVVEDNAASADVLCRTAAALGWRVDSCDSGLAALEMVERARQAGRPYDVLLMDWQMPGLDGLATARRLRSLPGHDKPPVVVMVSAFGREVLADAQFETEPAFSAFLSKPVTPEQLRDCVERALTGNLLSEAEHAPAKRRLQGLHLLLVEDNQLNRQVAQALLAGEGARVDLAEGGEIGVRKILQSNADPFDLVLMDMQMPDIDGLQATRRIREQKRYATLPIVAMTANVSESDRQACLAAGMDDHLGKPVDLEKMVEKILRWTGHVAAPSEAPAPVAAVQEDAADDLLEPQEAMLARFGGDRGLIASALPSLGHDVKLLLERLEEACSAGEAEPARAALHAIKGSAATAGAVALSRRAGVLEQGLRRHDKAVLAELGVADWKGELMDLLQQSLVLLSQRFAGAEAQTPKPSAEVSDEDLQVLLQRLASELESANLAASDTARTLRERLPAAYSTLYAELTARIAALDYRAARQLVRRLIAELPS